MNSTGEQLRENNLSRTFGFNKELHSVSLCYDWKASWPRSRQKEEHSIVQKSSGGTCEACRGEVENVGAAERQDGAPTCPGLDMCLTYHREELAAVSKAKQSSFPSSPASSAWARRKWRVRHWETGSSQCGRQTSWRLSFTNTLLRCFGNSRVLRTSMVRSAGGVWNNNPQQQQTNSDTPRTGITVVIGFYKFPVSVCEETSDPVFRNWDTGIDPRYEWPASSVCM